MKDFLGQDINVGDTIVYPNRQGSNLWMNQAQVTEVRVTGLRVQLPDGQIKPLQRVDRVVVVTQQKLLLLDKLLATNPMTVS